MVKHSAPAGNRFNVTWASLSVCVISRNVALSDTANRCPMSVFIGECHNAGLIWLGERAGYLSDWSTQLWVRGTGRRLNATKYPWLDGPIGHTTGVGENFLVQYATERGLEVVGLGKRGLLHNFEPLVKSCGGSDQISEAVRSFYQETSEYELDAWSEWRDIFRPFGVVLAKIFSRRLQQLNVPLSGLDSSKGMTSDVLQLRDPHSGRVVQTAWIRRSHATGNVLYAGAYSLCEIPGLPDHASKLYFHCRTEMRS
jgi:hypothetical protein